MNLGGIFYIYKNEHRTIFTFVSRAPSFPFHTLEIFFNKYIHKKKKKHKQKKEKQEILNVLLSSFILFFPLISHYSKNKGLKQKKTIINREIIHKL